MISLRKKVNQRLAELELVRQRCRQESANLKVAEQYLEDVQESQVLVQQVAQRVQQEAHDQIAGVVSRCLEAVFGEDCYSLEILFKRLRGRTEAQLVFERDGVRVDPLSASGGGVIDVAAFALRLSCLLLIRPPLRRMLILDEPFKFLSVEYRGKVRSLLELLSREMGVQILLVTHVGEFQAGKVIQLSR